jgi:hypothetical protein
LALLKGESTATYINFYQPLHLAQPANNGLFKHKNQKQQTSIAAPKEEVT